MLFSLPCLFLLVAAFGCAAYLKDFKLDMLRNMSIAGHLLLTFVALTHVYEV